MNNQRKQLYVPREYGLRLILFPLMAGIVLTNVLILLAFGIQGAGLLHNLSAEAIYIIAGIEILLVISYMVFATLGAHHLAGPMHGLESAMQKVGDGDLTSELHFRKHDFHAEVPNVFNNNIGRLRTAIHGIKQKVDELGTSLQDSEQANALLADLQQQLAQIKTEGSSTDNSQQPENSTTKKNRQAGFSLIELMTVVAIISILAVVAMPAYFEYAVRSRVTEGLAIALDARTTVGENVYSSASDLCKGVNLNHTGTGLADFACDAGILTLTMDDDGGNTVVTLTPVLLPGGVDWQCSGVPEKYVPYECR